MALSRDEINSVYRRRLNRDADEGGFQAYSRLGSIADVDKSILGSEEYRSLPMNQANREFNPALAANDAKLIATKAGNLQDQTDLETRIRENALKAEGSLTENFNNLGLLQSGRTAAGLGDIEKTTTGDLNRAAINRTLADAQATLESFNFGNTLAGQKTQRTAQLADNQVADSGRNFALGDRTFEQDLAKQGFDVNKLKSVTDIYSAFLDSGEPVPPWLYEKLQKVTGV